MAAASVGTPSVRSRITAGVRAGMLATATMDLAMTCAAWAGGGLFVADRLGPGMIGRWAAGLVRGRWRRADLLDEPPVRGEVALGIATHYATGIALTEAFLLVGGPAPSRRSAVAYGLATAVFPVLVMFPSMGYGPFGLRSGEAARLDRIMLVGHAGFGLGIALWARRRAETPAAR